MELRSINAYNFSNNISLLWSEEIKIYNLHQELNRTLTAYNLIKGTK